MANWNDEKKLDELITKNMDSTFLRVLNPLMPDRTENDQLTIPVSSMPRDSNQTVSDLCDVCYGITLEALQSDGGYLHSEDALEFMQSEITCPACDMIRRQILNGIRMVVFRKEEIVDPMEALEIYSFAMADRGLAMVSPIPVLLRISQNKRNLLDSHPLLPGTVAVNFETNQVTWISFGAMINLHDNKRGSMRPVRPRGSQEELLCRLSSWLRERQAEVPAWSGLETDQPLPTRVLDLGDYEPPEADLRLVEAAGSKSQYVALSYCWGGYKDCRTLRSNYQERLNGITFQNLPKLFADAVKVTRGLGIRYLWIDALCIIQEDADDWRREAALMCDVYWNTACRLAVNNSKNPTEGFFPPRDLVASVRVPNHMGSAEWQTEEQTTDPQPEDSNDEEVSNDLERRENKHIKTAVEDRTEAADLKSEADLHSETEPTAYSIDREKQNSIFSKFVDGDFDFGPEEEDPPLETYLTIPRFYTDEVDSGHLNSRGWVLQERLLSRRTIHFTRDHVYCEDQDDLCGEDWVRRKFTWLSAIDKKSTFTQIALFPERNFESPTRFADNMKENNIWTMRSFYRNSEYHGVIDPWLRIPEIFSECNLSCETDRLAAISGLVKRKEISYSEDGSQQRNLLGIWERDLHVQLAWAAKGESKLKLLRTLNLPSWAWLAYEGQVVFTRERRWSRAPGPVRNPPVSEVELVEDDVPDITAVLPLAKVPYLALRLNVREVHTVSTDSTSFNVHGQSWDEFRASSPFHHSETTGTWPKLLPYLSDCREIRDQDDNLVGFAAIDEDADVPADLICGHISTLKDHSVRRYPEEADGAGDRISESEPSDNAILATALVLAPIGGSTENRQYRRIGLAEVNYDWMLGGTKATLKLR